MYIHLISMTYFTGLVYTGGWEWYFTDYFCVYKYWVMLQNTHEVVST